MRLLPAFLFFSIYLKEVFPQTFPLLIGGFSGATTVDSFQFDDKSNLIITGRSTDTSLVTIANSNFAMLMPGGTNSYAWTVQLPFQNEAITSLAYRGDHQRWVLFYKSTLLIVLDSSNGALLWAIKETSSPTKFMC